jgi:hypothetical protein
MGLDSAACFRLSTSGRKAHKIATGIVMTVQMMKSHLLKVNQCLIELILFQCLYLQP